MIISVKEAIERELLKDERWEGVGLSSYVYEVIRNILGEGLSSQIEMAGFRGGIVWIKTPNAVFSQELSLWENEIVNRVNKVFNKPILKGIRFREAWHGRQRQAFRGRD
ncbi:DciA family protein [Hippea sp. KM1]|uniref:DciA family protein n=1 Tax=Hippea sp. KM1 TaxID=944481 RepID=UPI00046CFD61|nr:DciA family protein [Hippea sp. KM1]